MKTQTRCYTFALLVVLGLLALAPAILRLLVAAAQANTIFVVSSASFETVVAPDSIATAFGSQLATTTAVGADTDPNTPGVQLPTTLGGTFVEVNGRRAGLFFISPTQINLLIPPETMAGVANVRVVSGNGVTTMGTVTVSNVAPAIFTANSDGRGAPAGVLLRVRQNGAQSFEPLLTFDAGKGRMASVPIDLGPPGEQVFLILFATGVRLANDANGDGNVNETVRVFFAGAETTPQFVGRVATLAGLDQANVLIPRSLIGRGKVTLSISAPGANASNVAEIEIAGGVSIVPPQVNSFGTGAALAGQAVTIQGNGFAATPTDNLVRIGDLEAPVTAAAPTQLTVIVPFGAESAPVSVRTPTGEGRSNSALNVRTSVSGVVETTARQPLSDVTVQLVSPGNGQTVTTKTGSNGVFVAADVPPGNVFLRVIGSSVATSPPLESLLLPLSVAANRDNPYNQTIFLQPASGASAQVGGNSFAGNGASFALEIPVFAPLHEEAALAQIPLRLQTGNVIFELASGAAVRFPNGATSGRITLTQIESSRVPVRFPEGVFSSVVVQLTPFGTTFDPGGKLSFPNPDGFPVGTQLKLFKLDQGERSANLGRFVEVGTAAVSSNGQRIETDDNAITEAAYYFVALRRQTTTVVGRALDADRTPVRRALIQARGQETLTDGNGGFILRNVPTLPGNDTLTVEASLLRATGRVERLQRLDIPVVKDGITLVTPELVFGSATINQLPIILAPAAATANTGQTNDIPIFAGDPDSTQPVNLTVTGASFASVSRDNAQPRQFTLRLTPALSDAGTRDLTLLATDALGGSTSRVIRLTVVIPNRAPVANNQNVATDEDTPRQITLTATDADNNSLTYMIVTPPTKGALGGSPPNLTYTPSNDFNGADSFTFKANDGQLDSNVATVTITVNPVNDAPVLTVPGPQTVKEGELLTFTVSATDVDTGQTLKFTAPTLPQGASFNEGTRQFNWTPGFNQSGTYTAVFVVLDNGTPPKSDSKSVTITVTNTNRAPVANAASVMTDEDKAVAITLTGSDPDGNTLTYSIVTQPGQGSLSGTAPNLNYTPQANFNGTDTFTFKVNDGSADSPPATITITVKPVNDAPVANAQQVTTDEDTPRQITLTGSDVDGDTLNYAVVTPPQRGTLSGNAPNLTYTPQTNFNGPDTFTFKVNDGKVDSPPATITITVRPINDPPVATPQSVATDEDTARAITLTGTDADNDRLTFMIVMPPTKGTLSGTAPQVTYTPNRGFSGTDSFTFKVNDGTVDSLPATVQITVRDVNNPPVLNVPGPQTVAEGQNLSFTVSATDPDSGQTVKLSAPIRPTGASFIESSGLFTWTPGFDQAGTYTAQFVATDNGSPARTDIKTVQLTVTDTNRAPRANAQTVTTNEDAPVSIVLTGSDPDGDNITLIVVRQPQHGTLSGNAPNLTYTPNKDANGTDTFSFKANDGKTDSPLAVVTINITPVNDPPSIVVPGTQDIKEGQAVNFQLMVNDVDAGQTFTFTATNLPTGATLSPTGAFAWTPGNKQAGTYTVNFSVTDNGTPPLNNTKSVVFNVTNPPPVATSQTITLDEDTPKAIALLAVDPDGDALTYTIINQPQRGTLTGTAPNLTYTPALNFNGTDSFTFKANDGVADSNTATINLTINPVNDPPVLNVPPAQTVNEGQPLNFSVSATDVETGQTLTFAAANLPSGASFNATTRAFSWTPSAGQRGNYTVNFTATDNGTPPRSDTKSVQITVTGVNRPPVARNQQLSTNEDQPQNFVLTASDPDGDPLTFVIVTPPRGGVVTGTVPNMTYTPNPNFSGFDSLTYKVRDAVSESNVAEISFTVNPINDAPVLNVPGAQTVAEGKLLSFTLTVTDPDTGQTFNFTSSNLPPGAQLNAATGVFNWTPSFTQSGVYNVSFSVTDNGAPPLSNTKTVQITVTEAQPQPPTADNKQVMTDEDTPVQITLTGSDPQGDPLTFSIVQAPAQGTLSGNPPNLLYSPTANFNGTDTFTYKANDGSFDSNVATVTITIKPVNDLPVAASQAVQVNEDTPRQITLSATDVENSPLTFMVVTQPTKGSLSGTAPNLTYTPNANTTGPDSFTFKANDGVADSNIATISITIGGANDPPVANDQSLSTNEDVAINVALTGSDPDGDALSFSIVMQPTKGLLTGNLPNLVYTPNANVNGADSFTFKVNDGTVDSNIATINITINPVNDAPVLTVPGAQTVDEGVLLEFTVSATDVDSGQTLTLSATSLPTGATFNAQTGLFNWTPGFEQAGGYSVSFTATDNGTPPLSNTKTVAITVRDFRRGPIANPQQVTTDEDVAKAITLTGSDPDSLPITFMIVTPPANGVLTGTPPNVTYTPNANFNGADSFTFKANNGTLDSNTATVSITVNPLNDAPTINAPDTRTANEGEAINFTVTANDVDAGQTLTFSSTTLPAGATFNTQTGAFAWTPAFNQAGSYSITFTVTDSGTPALNAMKTTSFTINDLNRPPVADSFPVSTNEDTAKQITLTGRDPDGDMLAFSIVAQPMHGTLTGTPPNMTYTPALNYVGQDTFTYKANDGKVDSINALVTITVTEINDAPVLTVPGTQNVNVGQPVGFTVSAADVDAGQTVSLSVANLPSGATFNAQTGAFSWTPASAGVFTVSFTATDNGTPPLSDTEPVQINVGQSNQAPTCSSQNITADEDTPKPITLACTDPNSNPLTYMIVAQPTHGTVTLNGTTATYTPAANYNGQDSFTFKANDGSLDSQTATVSLTVNPVCDAPVLTVPGAQNVNTRSELVFTVTASDVDGGTLTLEAMNLPTGATFTPSANLGEFRWTPAQSFPAGPVTVTFKVTDNCSPTPLTDTKTVTINVTQGSLDWTQTPGPEGGKITALAVGANNNIFAATQGGGVFRSTDNGNTWTASNSGLTNRNITALVFRNGTLYAGTAGDGVFRSTDNGGSWSPFNTGLSPTFVFHLVANDTHLFAAAAPTVFQNQNIYRTPLNEANWSVYDFGLTPTFFTDLVISGARIFASTFTEGILTSPTAEANWADFNVGLPGAGASQLRAKRGTPAPSGKAARLAVNVSINSLTASGNKVYAATNEGVFVSSNTEPGWSAFNTGLNSTQIVTIEALGTTLYARTETRFFVPVDMIVYDVVKSPLDAANWTTINTGITNRAVNAFAANDSTVFAGTEGSGVYRTSNAGANWTAINTGLVAAFVNVLFVKDNLLLAGTDGGGVFISSNNGQSWTEANNGLSTLLPLSINAFTLSGSTIFAGTNGRGVYRSTDDGANWSAFNTSAFNNTGVRDLIVSDNKLFAAAGDLGLFSSQLDTPTWTQVGGLPALLEITTLFKASSNLFFGTGGGSVYRSDLAGTIWAQVGMGLDNTAPVTSFALRGMALFVGRNGDGVYRSTDNGETFTKVVSGLTNQSVSALRGADSRVYAATNGGGVFVTSNDGTSWTQIISNLTNLRTRTVVVKDNVLFVGTEGSGVFSRPQ